MAQLCRSCTKLCSAVLCASEIEMASRPAGRSHEGATTLCSEELRSGQRAAPLSSMTMMHLCLAYCAAGLKGGPTWCWLAGRRKGRSPAACLPARCSGPRKLSQTRWCVVLDRIGRGAGSRICSLAAGMRCRSRGAGTSCRDMAARSMRGWHCCRSGGCGAVLCAALERADADEGVPVAAADRPISRRDQGTLYFSRDAAE